VCENGLSQLRHLRLFDNTESLFSFAKVIIHILLAQVAQAAQPETMIFTEFQKKRTPIQPDI
jgi:hypothetical protein